ncbi:MAG: helix-hairpin-helix domain-containing protein [Chitinophagaceae bacterium]|nr:helix-hairpin-helix domain-containing protein [Chitinophagaceae bacterium]
MKSEDFVKEYFQFSKKDRIALSLLLVLILVIFLVPYFLPGSTIPPVSIASVGRPIQEEEKAIPNPDHGSFDSYSSRTPTTVKHFLGFDFDPNTIEATEWQKLGLRDRTIHTILNFRSKGGRFRTADDLQKIYGLRPEEFTRLKPFIHIASAGNSQYKKPEYSSSYPEGSKKFSERPLIKKQVIDINEADTSAWIALPGIGSKLSSRIVNFREKLGGFYSIEQVSQTFGLPDSVFQRIRPMLRLSVTAIKKININLATEDDLKAHPYLRWQLAKAVIAYRKEHGLFHQLEELRNIMAFSEETYNKVAPYLVIQ